MSIRLVLLLTICLLTPAVATAQSAGGGHGHGGRRGDGSGGPAAGARPSNAPSPPPTPVDQVQVVGVVQAIDAVAGRITIQYEATEALNLPAGTTPFEVSKTGLLQGVSVGEKVRFRLESHQIADIKPF
jgi:Cu/Ag efflux protein CusF